MHLEEVLDQLSVGALSQGSKAMSRDSAWPVAARADLLRMMGCLLCEPPSVADSAIEEALAVTPISAVQLFETPEAAARKDGALGVGRKLHRGERHLAAEVATWMLRRVGGELLTKPGILNAMIADRPRMMEVTRVLGWICSLAIVR